MYNNLLSFGLQISRNILTERLTKINLKKKSFFINKFSCCFPIFFCRLRFVSSILLSSNQFAFIYRFRKRIGPSSLFFILSHSDTICSVVPTFYAFFHALPNKTCLLLIRTSESRYHLFCFETFSFRVLRLSTRYYCSIFSVIPGILHMHQYLSLAALYSSISESLSFALSFHMHASIAIFACSGPSMSFFAYPSI